MVVLLWELLIISGCVSVGWASAVAIGASDINQIERDTADGLRFILTAQRNLELQQLESGQ